jgi:hypothetical protein
MGYPKIEKSYLLIKVVVTKTPRNPRKLITTKIKGSKSDDKQGEEKQEEQTGEIALTT